MVIDLDGVSFWSFFDSRVITFIKAVISMNNEHYPECCGQFFIINAPKGLDVLWNSVIAV